MSDRVRITKAIIDATEAPESDRIVIRDSEAKGLQLRITSNNARSWYWVGRAKGNTQYVKLGDYPDLPVARARIEAARINADVADGKRPETRAAKSAGEMTLIALHRWYMENISIPHRKSWKVDQQVFDLYWKDFRHHGLSEIHRSDVTRHHVKLGKNNGPVAANTAVKLLMSMYKVADKYFGYEGANPASGVERFKTEERERFLSPEEIARFFTAVDTLKNRDARDIFVLCLLTGARRHNVAAMRWDQIDEEKMTWTVPGRMAKKKKTLTIILVPEAMDIINARSKVAEFVFYSKRAASGHYTWPKNSWKKVCEAAEFKDVVIHDLRRTFASYQAEQNISLHTIAKTMGHGSVASTNVYARLQTDAIRAAVHTGVQTILKHRTDQKPVNAEIDRK